MSEVLIYGTVCVLLVFSAVGFNTVYTKTFKSGIPLIRKFRRKNIDKDKIESEPTVEEEPVDPRVKLFLPLGELSNILSEIKYKTSIVYAYNPDTLADKERIVENLETAIKERDFSSPEISRYNSSIAGRYDKKGEFIFPHVIKTNLVGIPVVVFKSRPPINSPIPEDTTIFTFHRLNFGKYPKELSTLISIDATISELGRGLDEYRNGGETDEEIISSVQAKITEGHDRANEIIKYLELVESEEKDTRQKEKGFEIFHKALDTSF